MLFCTQFLALLVDAFQELFLHCLFYWVNAHNNLGNKIFPSFLCSTNDLLDFTTINVLVSSSSSITLKNKKIKNKNKTILLSWGGIEGKKGNGFEFNRRDFAWYLRRPLCFIISSTADPSSCPSCLLDLGFSWSLRKYTGRTRCVLSVIAGAIGLNWEDILSAG